MEVNPVPEPQPEDVGESTVESPQAKLEEALAIFRQRRGDKSPLDDELVLAEAIEAMKREEVSLLGHSPRPSGLDSKPENP